MKLVIDGTQPIYGVRVQRHAEAARLNHSLNMKLNAERGSAIALAKPDRSTLAIFTNDLNCPMPA